MKISVITAMYNSEATLTDNIRSVNAQTHPDVEQIFIDGASTDHSVQVARDHAQKPFQLISEPDDGIYDAFNKGLALATGEVMAFLNTDDLYAADDVLAQVSDVFESQDVDAVYGDLVYVSQHDIRKVRRYWKSGSYRENAFLKGWLPPHPTFMCKKQVYEKYGLFDTRLKIAADYELMFRFIQRHKISLAYLPRVLVKMRSGGRSNTVKGVIEANMEVFEAFRQNGYPVHWRASVMKPLSKVAQYFRKPPASL